MPGQVEVNRNRVRVEATSDRSDEMHVHGYGKPIESHNSGLLLFQLVVRG